MERDFTSSALIGHAVTMNLTAKLVERGVLTAADMHAVMDDALFLLERFQKDFPEHDAAFEEARQGLEPVARFYGRAID
jgi:hypothetical protein